MLARVKTDVGDVSLDGLTPQLVDQVVILITHGLPIAFLYARTTLRLNT
jgi:hypothetical protein